MGQFFDLPTFVLAGEDGTIAIIALITSTLTAISQFIGWLRANRPKVTIQYEVVSPTPEEYFEDYDKITATYVRGNVPIAFGTAAFLSFFHGWEYYPIYERDPISQSETKEYKFPPEATHGNIIGVALLGVNGKWYFSEELKWTERRRLERPENRKRPPYRHLEKGEKPSF